MLGMNPLSTVYATKRRRRNGKSLKPPPKDGVTKSNPSKRHRERLNAELDTLANLLPFEQNILSKLDRLSILRLSVSYLRTKSYFQDTMHNSKEEVAQYRSRSELNMYEHVAVDGDMFLQALNGFLVILTCEGEVFFATHTIESYLGFHQSDIVHQSVYELVHSEDREELQRQLMWNSFLPPEQSGITLQEAILPENSHLLERNFTVRFRCLLDNTSGFLRLDIRGRVKVLHGQYRKTEEPPLALFAICTPFGPPSLLEIPHKEVMFKSKHKLDLSLVSMDQRGKILLGYSDSELANMGGYDLVHYDDLAYVASAHQELLKTGASGMIAYRYQTKDGPWQWLQTSSRLVYKNSKPDFVICTHRPLMEEEGRDLVGKRTMDFKVSYLDAGLTNSYFSDSDQLLNSSSNQYSSSSTPVPPQTVTTKSPTPQRINRRYKTQLRDFVSTCRTKRKLNSHHHHHHQQHNHHQPAIVHPTPTTPAAVDYIAAAGADPTAAAAVAVAYSNLNTMYPSAAYPSAGGVTPADNSLSYMGHGGNFHQTLYDNRLPYLTTTDNLFHQYRPLGVGVGNYYTDYHSPAAGTPYVSNGFLEIPARASPSSLPTYDTSAHHHAASAAVAIVQDNSKLNECDKLYSCNQSLIEQKYSTAVAAAAVMDNNRYVTGTKCIDVPSPYNMSSIVPSTSCGVGGGGGNLNSSARIGVGGGGGMKSIDHMSAGGESSPVPVTVNGLITSKMEDVKTEVLQHYSPLPAEPPRQTVLMWALNHTPQSSVSSGRSPTENSSNASTPPVLINGSAAATSSSQYIAAVAAAASRDNTKKYVTSDPLKSLAEMNTMPVAKWKTEPPPSPKAYYHHQYTNDGGTAPEVWPPPHHQFYPYHHHHHTAVARSGMVAECGYPQINRTGVLCCPSRR
ncbi:uncharacterized protein ss isoform X2 [Planococcus citri]|uniref:uncharacterized protein ss isoform X2 n=1 Tax=Planococcus citri TaxID=170843 RepID=UPI0031F780BA